MVTYKTEVLGPTSWTSPQNMAKQVQSRLDAFTATGWRLASMASVGGSGGLVVGAAGSYLVLVFERD